jgi:very-short-patch-repair endonuclease
MKKYNTSYNNLSDKDKKELISELYSEQGQSFADIAESYDTYANKIRRDAIKFNIKIRDKSEAQKNALKTGKHSHPTKGKERSQSTKQKIGLGVLNAWENLDETEIASRKLKAKQNWDNLDEDTKQNILRSANQAVRVTSKTGSKLEKYLHKKLLSDGYKVEFHKEQVLVNTKLQIDLFVPIMKLAIEVDGPSHFEPVWGEQSLSRNKTYDAKKEGLIVGRGWNLIRIVQTKDYSEARALLIYQSLIDTINRNTKQLESGQQKFIIKDNNG